MLETTPLYTLTRSQVAKEETDVSTSTSQLDPPPEVVPSEIPALPKSIPILPGRFNFRRALTQPTGRGKPFSVVEELLIVAVGMSIIDVLRSYPE